MNTKTEKLHDLPEAASLLGGISTWTLRRWITVGNVSAVRLGRRIFLRSEEVERIRRDGLPSLGEKAAQSRSRCKHCTHGPEVVDQQSPKSEKSNAASAAEGRSK